MVEEARLVGGGEAAQVEVQGLVGDAADDRHRQAAQGGFVELTFPEAGHYTFVSHVMIDAERGAHGTVRVTD